MQEGYGDMTDKIVALITINEGLGSSDENKIPQIEEIDLNVKRKKIIYTTVDEIDGETVREYGYNYQNAYGRATELAAATGIPREEILKGMWFGIQEFLATHPEWYIKDRFFNNNGLMILAKR